MPKWSCSVSREAIAGIPSDSRFLRTAHGTLIHLNHRPGRPSRVLDDYRA